jgi:hypothetical protein
LFFPKRLRRWRAGVDAARLEPVGDTPQECRGQPTHRVAAFAWRAFGRRGHCRAADSTWCLVALSAMIIAVGSNI